MKAGGVLRACALASFLTTPVRALAQSIVLYANDDGARVTAP